MTTDNGLYRFPVTYEGLPQAQPFLVDAEGDTLDNDLILADTPQDLKLTVTMSQYTALLSAALNGANRHYGENYIDVIYPLIKAGKNLAGNMSCDDIADCIETSESVLNALMQQLASQGFQQSPETTSASNVKPLPASITDQTMLPVDYDCSTSENNMAIARAIVRELHETVLDLLESVEYATNAAEAANIATDGVPIVGTLNNVLELADWLLESLTELYQASYTQAVEDEIACAIFCYLETDCSLSLNELIDIYESVGGELPPDMSSLESAITGLVDIPLSAGVVTVAVAHCWVLWVLRFGGDFAGIKGWKSIENLVRSSATYIDVSYEDCGCTTETPTLYWKIEYDFRNGAKFNTATTTWNGSPNDGAWVGNGYQHNAVNVSTTNIAFGIADLGAQYNVVGHSSRQVRRGGDGSGTNDISTYFFYPNASYGGTAVSFGNTGGISTNTNDFEHGTVNPFSTVLARSIQWRQRVQENASLPTAMLRCYAIVVWGEAGVGDTKPPYAVWAGNTLPATHNELWGDYTP